MTDTDKFVLTRYLVTQKGQFRPGNSTRYIEHLSNGTLVIRQNNKSSDIQYTIYNPQTHIQDAQSNKISIIVDDRNKAIIYKFASELEKLKFLESIQNNTIENKNNNNELIQYPHSTRMFSYLRNEKSRLFIYNVHGMRQGSIVSHCGMLVFTNYRIIFVQYPGKDHSMPSEVILMKYATVTSLEIGHLSILQYEISKSNKKTIIIDTKDFRTIRFDLSDIKDTNSSLFKLVITTIDECIYPNKLSDTFAYNICSKTNHGISADDSHHGISFINDNASDTEDHDDGDIIIDEKHENKYDDDDDKKNKSYLAPLFSFGKNRKINTLNKEDTGISFSNLNNECIKSMIHGNKQQTKKLRDELNRICEIGNGQNKHKKKFRISTINSNLTFCKSYPSLFIVPTNVSDELLEKSGKFRSKQRLPVIVWSNKDGISISRSSQPLPGMVAKRNKYDEEYLSLLTSTNPSRRILLIFDMRPKVNAMANRMKGSGYEMNGYSNCDIRFMDIDNIHVMRTSLNNMLFDCILAPKDDQWMIRLTNSEWLNHLSKIIYASIEITQSIIRDKHNVLIHCSDGWDRTCQSSALTQLILDPYYKTIHGFLLLIQKEFIWFGHKFAQRLGNFGKISLKKLSTNQRSPIFVQFLDAVYQIMIQQPNIFEFTEELLLTLYDCSINGMYGDFFGDNNYDRLALHTTDSCYSIFSASSPFYNLNQKQDQKSNPMATSAYTAFHTPSSTPEPPNINGPGSIMGVGSGRGAVSYKALYVNGDFDRNASLNTKMIVSHIQYEVSSMVVWNKCYGRFNKYDVDLRDPTQTALKNNQFSFWDCFNFEIFGPKMKEFVFKYTAINYLFILNGIFWYFYTVYYHYNYYFIDQDTNPFISNVHLISMLILCFMIAICCSVEWKRLRVQNILIQMDSNQNQEGLFIKFKKGFNINWFIGNLITLLMHSSLFIHYISYQGVEYKFLFPFFDEYNHLYNALIGIVVITMIGLIMHYGIMYMNDDKQKHFQLMQKLDNWSSESNYYLQKYNSAAIYLKLFPQSMIMENKTIKICIKLLDLFEIRKSLLYLFSIWIIYLIIYALLNTDNYGQQNNAWYLMIIMGLIYILYSLIAICIKEKSGIESAKWTTEIAIKLTRKMVYILSCLVISFGLGSYYILMVLYRHNFIGLIPNKEIDLIISLVILFVSTIIFGGIIPFICKWILWKQYKNITQNNNESDVENTNSPTQQTLLANKLHDDINICCQIVE